MARIVNNSLTQALYLETASALSCNAVHLRKMEVSSEVGNDNTVKALQATSRGVRMTVAAQNVSATNAGRGQPVYWNCGKPGHLKMD